MWFGGLTLVLHLHIFLISMGSNTVCSIQDTQGASNSFVWLWKGLFQGCTICEPCKPFYYIAAINNISHLGSPGLNANSIRLSVETVLSIELKNIVNRIGEPKYGEQ